MDENTNWEVHVGHYGVIPGDGHKLISTTKLSEHETRGAAWEEAIRLAETAEVPFEEVLVRKPLALLWEGPYPTNWDKPPDAIRWNQACERGHRAGQLIASGRKVNNRINARIWREASKVGPLPELLYDSRNALVVICKIIDDLGLTEEVYGRLREMAKSEEGLKKLIVRDVMEIA